MNIIRILLYPISNGPLVFLLNGVKERYLFENQNETDSLSESFKKQGLRADWGLEVSSEGELEQVLPLILEMLRHQLKVELYFASPSVEAKCIRLAEEWKGQLRIFRLPLLTYFPWGNIGQSILRWGTANRLILCRYDFYPELILPSTLNDKGLVLLSATLKGKDYRGRWLKSQFIKGLYRSFDQIICATELDQKKFIELGIIPSKMMTYDFRVLQVHQRVEKREQVLNKHLFWGAFSQWLEQQSRENRLIMGSAWPLEMNIFKNSEFLKGIGSGEYKVVVAPHQLGAQSITEFEEVWDSLSTDLPLYYLSHDSNQAEVKGLFKVMEKRPGLLILGIRGVLVELYQYFGHAFVGGGHGRSIHSVLEPYIADCQLFCGPKTFRSTEYDFVKLHSPQHVHIIEVLGDFYTQFKEYKNQKIDDQTRLVQIGQHKSLFPKLIKDIFIKKGKHA